MKHVSKMLVILSILVLAGCSLPPADKPPSTLPPGFERIGFAVEVYSPIDKDRPTAERIPKLGRIDVDIDGTDSLGGKGVLGAGNVLPFHDPGVSTPYFYGFSIQTGLATHLIATVTYFGLLGETVRCWFEDGSGNEYLSTRKEGTILGVSVDQTRGLVIVKCEDLVV